MMGNGKAIVDEYLAGRQAARAGQPLPRDASVHFRDGHDTVRREMRQSEMGERYRHGHISFDQWRDFLRA